MLLLLLPALLLSAGFVPISLPVDLVGSAAGIQNQRDPTACEEIFHNWTSCVNAFASNDSYAYANETAAQGGQVTVGDVSTDAFDGATQRDITHTVASGDNLLLVGVVLETTDPNKEVSSVVWDPTGEGQALTRFTTFNPGHGKMRTEVWRLVNPSVETAVVRVNLEDTQKVGVVVVSFANVDTTTPLDGTATQDGTGTSGSVSVTQEADDLAFVFAGHFASNGEFTPGLGETEHADFPVVGTFKVWAASEDGPGATTLSWNAGGGNSERATVGFNVNSATGTSQPGKNDTAWRDFGFALNASDSVTSVEVGVEWFRNNTAPILNVTVSWDGGTSWATNQTATNKSSDDDTMEFLDFTSATAWDADKLSDANLRVRIGTNDSGAGLDYVTVRVNFNRAPSVSSFRLEDGGGASKAGEQLDVNTTYYFLFNVTDDDGWSDIGEDGSVSLRLWYDGNATPELTFGEQTAGSNYRIELRYADVSDPSTASLSEWSVVEGSATYNASASSLTPITSGSTTIGYEFKLAIVLGFQVKHAVDPTDATAGDYNDADSWNAEVVATDGTSTTTLQAASTGEHLEFGVFQYTFVNISGDWTVSLGPGETQATNSVVVHHRSNDAFTLKVWFVSHLTKGGDTVSITNVQILAAADPDDNITADTFFAGTGESNAVYILGTSTWYFPHSADGDESTTTVQFRVTIPLGTPPGPYTASLTIKVEQQPP